VPLVIASTLLPWGWLFLRTSIVLGILGIIQIVALGYGTFLANRFFRYRIQRIVSRLLANLWFTASFAVPPTEWVRRSFLARTLFREIKRNLTRRWSERRTALRSTLEMISTLSLRATRGLVRRRSSCSR
jgi:hypothetical protein